MLGAGRIAAIVIIGGIAGAGLDQICHVRFGVLWYPRPEPGLFDQPWWVAPQFGIATLVTILASIPFARAARPITRETWISPIAAGLLWLVGAYLASGVFADHKVPLIAAFGALFIGRIALRPERWILLAGGIVLAVGGSGYEILVSRAGLFRYANPDWVVPMWLPGIYLHAAPLAIAITQALDAPKLPAPARA